MEETVTGGIALKKNAGFSLIELIVTVAILGILSAGVVTIVLSRSGREAQKAAQQISAALSETRAQALAKTQAWMRIKMNTAGEYVIETSYSGNVTLGKKCTISYVGGGSGTISETESLILSYDRASGAFYPVGSDDTTLTFPLSNGYCKTITVSVGSNRMYELTLYKETGKHELKKI